MIASGEKKEEYREIKPYWISRLCSGFPSKYDAKDFDIIAFKNGYSKEAPTINVKWVGMDIRQGKAEWGAEPGKEYFVIQLGDVITN